MRKAPGARLHGNEVYTVAVVGSTEGSNELYSVPLADDKTQGSYAFCAASPDDPSTIYAIPISGSTV